MEAKKVLPMAICPIQFNSFNQLLEKIGCIEASVLYCLLHFQWNQTKITKNSVRCIARSREQMATWLSLSTRKIDTLLKILEKKGFIRKRCGLWYGKKRLFINCLYQDDLKINLTLLNILVHKTGSIKSAVIFAKLLFASNNTKILEEGITWCSFKKKTISDWAGISIRTLDTILNKFVKNNLLLKKNLNRYGKKQQHFHIYQNVINQISLQFTQVNDKNSAISKQQIKTTNVKICRSQPAKNEISIRRTTNLQEKRNINISLSCDTKLSDDVRMALAQKQTVSSSHLREIVEQVKYAIQRLLDNKTVKSIRHALYRCLKIIRDGNWKVPFGFYKYSEYGCNLVTKRDINSQTWEAQKAQEIGQRQIKPLQNNLLNQQLQPIAHRLKAFKDQFSLSTEQKQQVEYLLGQAKKLIGLGADKQILVQAVQ